MWCGRGDGDGDGVGGSCSVADDGGVGDGCGGGSSGGVGVDIGEDCGRSGGGRCGTCGEVRVVSYSREIVFSLCVQHNIRHTRSRGVVLQFFLFCIE